MLQIETQAALKDAYRKWIETALKKSKMVRESKWTQNIAVGDKPFVEQIKERLGIRAKGRKIRESGDGYQLSERQALYGEWHDAVTENRFNWNLAI